jgi:hypothetical protein
VRFFLPPGVAHCGGGAGPAPYGQLDALLSWMEEGNAPATIPPARRDQALKINEVQAALPICAGGQVQGRREHGQRGELCLQHRILGSFQRSFKP